MPRIRLTAVSVCGAAISSWTPWEVCCRILPPYRAETILLPASLPPLAVGAGFFALGVFRALLRAWSCDAAATLLLPESPRLWRWARAFLRWGFSTRSDLRSPIPSLYPFDAPADSRIPDPLPYPFGAPADSGIRDPLPGSKRQIVCLLDRSVARGYEALVGTRRSGQRPRGPHEVNIALGTWGSSAGVRWLVDAKASGATD